MEPLINFFIKEGIKTLIRIAVGIFLFGVFVGIVSHMVLK